MDVGTGVVVVSGWFLRALSHTTTLQSGFTHWLWFRRTCSLSSDCRTGCCDVSWRPGWPTGQSLMPALKVVILQSEFLGFWTPQCHFRAEKWSRSDTAVFKTPELKHTLTYNYFLLFFVTVERWGEQKGRRALQRKSLCLSSRRGEITASWKCLCGFLSEKMSTICTGDSCCSTKSLAS